MAAIRLHQVITIEWLMGFSGALSIVFGLLAQPGAGALILVYLFGFFAVPAGISQIGLGFRLRGLGQTDEPSTRSTASASH